MGLLRNKLIKRGWDVIHTTEGVRPNRQVSRLDTRFQERNYSAGFPYQDSTCSEEDGTKGIRAYSDFLQFSQAMYIRIVDVYIYAPR